MKKISFNFFTSGVCVKEVGNDLMIFVVLYNNTSGYGDRHQIRIPGGTVQFVDIIEGIKNVASRIKLDEGKIIWLCEKIEEISARYDEKRSGMKFDTKDQKLDVREVFISHLSEVEEAVESLVYSGSMEENALKIIENSVKEQTLRRELRYEGGIKNFESVAECGCVIKGEHKKYVFLVLGSDVPDKYDLSADSDIISAFLWKLDKLKPEQKTEQNPNPKDPLYQGHKDFLFSALALWLQINKRNENKEKIIKKVEEFLKLAD